MFISRKKYKIIRTLIYAVGAAIVVFVLFGNIYEKKSTLRVQTKNDLLSGRFFVFETINDYTSGELELVFKTEEFDSEDIEINFTKSFSVLSRPQRSVVENEEDLNQILFRDNSTPYPNGSLLLNGKKKYLVDKGKPRLFASEMAIQRFGFEEEDFQPSDLAGLEVGNIKTNPLLKKISASDENFPYGVILKSGHQLFVIGSNGIYPISSTEIIESAWHDYSFIETVSLSKNDLHSVGCQPRDTFFNIKCTLPFNEVNNNNGNAYFVSVSGISQDKLEKVFLRAKRNFFLKNALEKIHGMLW